MSGLRWLLLAAVAALHLMATGAAPADGSQTSFTCQITMSHITQETGSREEVACIYDQDSMYPFESFPKDLYRTYLTDITQGTLWMEVSPARLTRRGRIRTFDDTAFTVLGTTYAGGSSLVSSLNSLGQPTALATPATGNTTLYIIRVSVSNASPLATLTQLKTEIIGTGTATSTRNQYAACSFGKLNLVLAGTSDVKLSYPLSYFASTTDLANAALEKVRKTKKLTYASQLAKKVMVVLPSGIGNYLAYAYINSWLSVYNDRWALSLSTTMHELGHNLGLLHSGIVSNYSLDASYGDMTGFMGYSESSGTYPLKCFNGFKNWQLGWYASNHLQINDPATVTDKINLAAFVDYKKAGNQTVVINIADTYFLQFNRAKSFNVNTEDSPNRVTVTRNDPSLSKAVAGLAAGEQFTVPGWQGTDDELVIEVCSITYNDAQPNATDVAVVSIGLNATFC